MVDLRWWEEKNRAIKQSILLLHLSTTKATSVTRNGEHTEIKANKHYPLNGISSARVIKWVYHIISLCPRSLCFFRTLFKLPRNRFQTFHQAFHFMQMDEMSKQFIFDQYLFAHYFMFVHIKRKVFWCHEMRSDKNKLGQSLIRGNSYTALFNWKMLSTFW